MPSVAGNSPTHVAPGAACIAGRSDPHKPGSLLSIAATAMTITTTTAISNQPSRRIPGSGSSADEPMPGDAAVSGA